MSRDQNAGQGHIMTIDNSAIERVEEFKYLGTTFIHSFIQYSVWRQVQRLFQNGSST
jgi:hypothetical protein